MNKRRNILLGICAVLIIGAAGAYVVRSQTATVPLGATHSIVLREAGFDPAMITIKKGDVVEFSTARDYYFWPASDQHPTHSEYAAFDPKRPIPKDEVWSFQFTKSGTWEYHDHLNSTLQGTIHVVE